jgi:PAS domain S-box-containing protein
MNTKPTKGKRKTRSNTSAGKTDVPLRVQKKPAKKKTESKSAKSINLFAELVAKMPTGILVFRLEDFADPRSLRLVALNAAASRIARLSAQETVGKLWQEFSPSAFNTELPGRYVEVVRSGLPQTIDDLRYGTERMPEGNFRVHLFPLLSDCIAVSFEDITARRQAEEIVRQMLEVLAPSIGKDYLRALVSHLALVTQADLTMVGRISTSNEKQIQTIVLWRDGALRDNLIFDIEGTPGEKVLQSGLCHFDMEQLSQFAKYPMLKEMGFGSYIGMPLLSSQGKSIGLFALVRRTSFAQPELAQALLRVVAARASAEFDRQLSEEALRASEEFLRMSQRAGNVGSWRWNLRTNEVQWSDSMYALYGMTLADFDGSLAGATRTTHPDDIPIMTDAITKTISEGAGRAFEYRVIKSDGEVAHLWSQSDVICDTAGVQTHVIGTVIDLTARKQLDAKIQQAQKLESLGVLAGGIAHDFNNILTSLLGYADLALLELPVHSSARPLVSEAVKAARRGAELTKQMLAYSGRGRFVVDTVNLNEVVDDMASLLQVSISKKCAIAYRFMPNLPTVEVDIAQMRQVIMNLIINAAEAVGDRSGTIELATGTMQCDREFLSRGNFSEHATPGEYVFVQVSDTGCGMTDETRARIFDPFFTTKFTGRGLGLAAVHGIVRGHRGIITVESKVNEGTVFKVVLPAGQAKASEQPAEIRDEELLRGSGVVLVVDDEEAIRDLASRMLAHMGFEVITACDGREAVKIFGSNADTIRLVLLDMTMPNLDGEETFDALRKIRGAVQVVLSSGYDEQSATRRFAGKGLAGFVQKPYTYEQLMSTCKHALAKAK